MTKNTTIYNKLTLDQIKERITDAREIQNGLTGHMAHTALPRFRNTMSKIDKDRNLSSQGKFDKKEKFRKQQEVLLLSEIAEAKETYNLLLSDAQASAEAILLSDVEKPDETAIKLFELEKNRLQSVVMFAPTAEAKAKSLTEFAKLGNKGQYFAREIQGEFIGLSQQAMAGVTDPQALANLARTLGKVNAGLQAAAFTEDQRVANELLGSVAAYKNGDFVNMVVLGDRLMEISKVTHDYANNLEGYQVDHADTISAVQQSTRYENIVR